MKLTQRVQDIESSITLKLNAKAVALSEEGKKIYNLTAGQLPFRPPQEFVAAIRHELDFLKSYQYSPVGGFSELIDKVLQHAQKSRGVSFKGHDVLICNGGKHAVTNVMATLIEPGDEVVLLAPYWVTYPPLVKLYGGNLKVASSSIFDNYCPDIESVESQLTEKTKLIIVNSPNNPAGVHYSAEWMKQFSELMKKYPHVMVLSDEIYRPLSYFDPTPTYFYQDAPELIERTIIVDGVSKVLASTGLRIGYLIAPKEMINAARRLQGQTTSGANSLVQKALIHYDFDQIDEFMVPIKEHLRKNAQLLKEQLRGAGLGGCWYQSTSAFYYLLDFSKAPFFQARFGDSVADHALEVCDDLLDNCGLALVPGRDFGMSNCARMSLVLEETAFKEALVKLIDFLKGS